jgi:hypothetical protein
MNVTLNPHRRSRIAEARVTAFDSGRFLLGAALAALAVGVLLEPAMARQEFFWAAWGAGALAALVLVLLGLGSRRISTRPVAVPAAARRTWPSEVRPAPRLGEILVDEMRMTTVNELERALAAPESRGRPLGEVAVEKGLITAGQRDTALERQSYYREHFGAERWD